LKWIGVNMYEQSINNIRSFLQAIKVMYNDNDQETGRLKFEFGAFEGKIMIRQILFNVVQYA